MRKKAPRRISIEALLIWTYRDQRAADEVAGLHQSEAEANGVAWSGRSGDGVAALMDRARLGCRIEGGAGKNTMTGRIHPDAEIVDSWVRAMGEETARLVIRHAAVGLRPEVPAAPRLEPLRWGWGADGRPEGESEPVPRELLGRPPIWRRDPRTGRGVLGEGCIGPGLLRCKRARGSSYYVAHLRWTPIAWRPDPEFMAKRRAIYEAWRVALLALRDLLSDAPLRDHILTQDTPPLAAPLKI